MYELHTFTINGKYEIFIINDNEYKTKINELYSKGYSVWSIKWLGKK